MTIEPGRTRRRTVTVVGRIVTWALGPQAVDLLESDRPMLLGWFLRAANRGPVAVLSAARRHVVVRNVQRWVHVVSALHERREAFGDPPAWLRAVLLSSCLVYVYALTRLALRDIPGVAGLAILYALTMLVPPVPSPLGMVRLPRLTFTVTLGLLWPPLHTLLGVALGTLLAVLIFRLYETERAILNTLFWAYPAALASAVGHAVLQTVPDPLAGPAAASLVIMLVYWPTNYALLALYRHFRWGEPLLSYWWSCVTENPLAQFLSAPLPVFLGAIAFGLGFRPWAALLVTGVAVLTMPSARTQITLYFASQRTARDMVRALMVALERVTPGAQAHAERVSELVGEAGRYLRVPAATLDVWRLAALLHDVGVLEAQNRTAPPEMQALAGARILANYPDAMLSDMVREHHTPWFRGPLRLGRAAALGARVLAAAESYDELRYGRGDTGGLASHEATTEAFQPLIGTQLDPRVAAVLLKTAERLEHRAAA